MGVRSGYHMHGRYLLGLDDDGTELSGDWGCRDEHMPCRHGHRELLHEPGGAWRHVLSDVHELRRRCDG